MSVVDESFVRGTAILMAGMHRSGTSATAGALGKCGVALGGRVIPAAADNPHGYFEHADAVQIHDELLRALGRSWDDTRSLPDGWMRTAAAATAARAIEELVIRDFKDASVWGVKDPRMSRFIALWREVLAGLGIRTVVLLVVRRPSEAASSVAARDGWSEAVGTLLWMRHVFEAEAASRGLVRTVITYDDLLADPAASLGLSASRLGIRLPVDPASISSDLKQFLRVDGRHHRHDPGIYNEGELEFALADEAYGALQAISASNAGWQALASVAERFDAACLFRSPLVVGLAEVATKLRQRAEESRMAADILRSDLNAQLKWSEEAVQRQERMHVELAEAKSALRAQIEWSEQFVDKQRQLHEAWAADVARADERERALHERLEQAAKAQVESELAADVRQRAAEDEGAKAANRAADVEQQLRAELSRIAQTMDQAERRHVEQVKALEHAIARRKGIRALWNW